MVTRVIIGISAIFALVAATCSRTHMVDAATMVPYEQRWYLEQLIDHRKADTASNQWMQRQFINTTFANASVDGSIPVILLVGGENQAETWWSILIGQAELSAQKAGAILVLLEHRFFGQSRPFGQGSSMSTGAMRGNLDPAQAALDIARFTVWASGSSHGVAFDTPGRNFTSPLSLGAGIPGVPPSSRWVALGCSYSGVVASIAALDIDANLLPGLPSAVPSRLNGTVASSAPAQLNTLFPTYHQGLQIAMSDPDAGGCPSTAANILLPGLQNAASLVSSNDTKDWSKFLHAMRMCPMTSGITHDSMRGAWRSSVDLTLGFIAVQSSRGYAVGVVCQALENATAAGQSPLEAVGTVLWLLQGGTPACIPVAPWSKYQALVRDETYSSESWTRQYVWLQCTAVGYLNACSDRDTCPYADASPGAVGPTPGDLLYGTICGDVLGVTSDETQARQSQILGYTGGGFASVNASAGRVLWVGGSADPYSLLTPLASKMKMKMKIASGLGSESSRDSSGFESPTSDLSMFPKPPPLLVTGGWHCSDMAGGPEDELPVAVAEARAVAVEQTVKWLQS